MSSLENDFERSKAIKTFIKIILSISIISFIILIKYINAEAHFDRSSVIEIDFRDFVTDNELKQSVADALDNRPQNILDGTKFTITSARIEDVWGLLSIASIDGLGCEMIHIGTGNCGSILLIHFIAPNNWEVTLRGTLEFSNLLRKAPDSFIAGNAKPLLDPFSSILRTSANVIYKFPWAPGSWEYRSGWNHDSYHPDALDIGTRGTDKRVLAAADGLIVNICKSSTGTSANVQVLDDSGKKLEYWHLNKSTLAWGIEEGKTVIRGQKLGDLLSGHWEWDGCGEAPTQTSAHLHWVIPLSSGESITVDGWTITFPDSTWRKGNETIEPNYQLITSTNYILVKHLKFIDVPYNLPGGWPYLFKATDDRIRHLDIGNWFSSNFGNCSDIWFNLEEGYHQLYYWYELRGTGYPTVDIHPWDPLIDFTNPPSACAAIPEDPPSETTNPTNDLMLFIADSNLQDGTVVTPGQALTKTWRVRNTGSTIWGSGYQLVFVSGDQMGGPNAVNLPSTNPGVSVDVSVNLTAPAVNGQHIGFWQLRNSQGTYFGPKINVDVYVRSASNKITVLSIDPPSPADTQTVNVAVKIEGMNNFRAMRLMVDGQNQGEHAGPEYMFAWDTSGFAAGAHSIVIEAADETDSSWSRPETRSTSYTLLGTTATPNLKPNLPTLVSPYDWYVYYSGNTGQLCAQANGDPDGDAITGYYFDIYESAELWNSGWTGNNCVTTAALGPHDYKWRVKVRDIRGAESDWSTSWHFTLVNPSLAIAQLYFVPLDSNSEQVKIYACTSGQGGIGITMRVDVQDDNGEWQRIKELGVPCFNDQDAPVWNTLEADKKYGDGLHKIRVEAHGLNSGWDGAAVSEGSFTLPHRRPSQFRLMAPVPASGNNHEAIFLNSQTVTFKWQSSLRANDYTLSIGTNPSPAGDPNPVFRQNFGSGTTEYTVSFNQSYPVLYWQVTANNDKGSISTVDQLFGIDQAAPTCTGAELASGYV